MSRGSLLALVALASVLRACFEGQCLRDSDCPEAQECSAGQCRIPVSGDSGSAPPPAQTADDTTDHREVIDGASSMDGSPDAG